MNVALRDELLDCLANVINGMTDEGVLNLSDAQRMVPVYSITQIQHLELDLAKTVLKKPVDIEKVFPGIRLLSQRSRKVGFELADLFDSFERNVQTLSEGDTDDQLWTYKIEVMPGVIYCIEFYKTDVYNQDVQRYEWMIKTGSIAVYKGDAKHEFTGANDLERFQACRDSVAAMSNITLQFVNLTPDTFITQASEPNDFYTHTPQGVVYVVPTERALYIKENICVTHTEREVKGLPEPEEGKIYIVTPNVLDALQGTRTDVMTISGTIDVYGRKLVKSFTTV